MLLAACGGEQGVTPAGTPDSALLELQSLDLSWQDVAVKVAYDAGRGADDEFICQEAAGVRTRKIQAIAVR